MQTDVLVIGCGIAGATAALQLAAERERLVTIITRATRPEESNSSYAQGGIVSRGQDDAADLLIDDVLRAGAGLSKPEAVRVLAEDGPKLIHQLLIESFGIEFDRDETGTLKFGLEGAHSRRRILHVRDETGQAIMGALLRELRGRPNIQMLPGHTGVDLLTFPHHAPDPLAVYDPPTCHGVYAFEQTTGRVQSIVTRHTVLATGGLGQIFLNTTNPAGARGDGLAMAYRAGARVVNAEYVQFHPTALHMPGTTKLLISEAVRGEGAVLLSPGGDAFMERYDPVDKELAGRDVVARAIYSEMLTNGYHYVLLDIARKRAADYVLQRFPGIHRCCLEHGIDITKQPIPVVPAAHYSCGGVLVDLWGRTTLPGLYALGEVACTGIHGANRLASTSLLEGLVWGARAAQDIRRQAGGRRISEDDVPAWEESGLYHADPALIQVDMQTIRDLMWHYVGLMRNEDRLDRAVRELGRLRFNIEEFYRRAYLSDTLIGLRNAVLTALIVGRAALQNPTTRGCHYREDSQVAGGAAPPVGNNDLEPGEELR